MRLVFSQATNVDPEPRKGSYSFPFLSELFFIAFSANSTGFCVGCKYDEEGSLFIFQTSDASSSVLPLNQCFNPPPFGLNP